MINDSALRSYPRDEPPPPTGRLEISSGGSVIAELPMEKFKLSIGRDPAGDILLDDPKISRSHAKLTRISSNYFIEDQGSTNGTLLNGRPVRKHIFRPGDSLRIGGFELRYLSREANINAENSTITENAVVQPTDKSAKVALGKASIHYIEGSRKGETEALNKPLLTIGRAGENVSVITCRANGFFLLHIGGKPRPNINGKEIGNRAVSLRDGDLIQVGRQRLRIHMEQGPQ